MTKAFVPARVEAIPSQIVNSSLHLLTIWVQTHHKTLLVHPKPACIGWFRIRILSPGCFCALNSLVFCTAQIVFIFVQALLVGPLFSVYVSPFAFYLLILIHSSLLGRTQYVDMGGHLYTNNFDKKILDIMYIHLCILTIGLDFVHCSPNERNSPLLDQISHPSILGWPKKALHCRSAMRHTTRRTELEQMGSGDPNLLLSSFSQWT